jgi:hypothetical protein
LYVFDGGGVVSHSDDGDGVEGAVGGSVSAPAETVSAVAASAAGWLGSNTAEFGEGGFVAYPLGVVAGGDQELTGKFGADTEQFD